MATAEQLHCDSRAGGRAGAGRILSGQLPEMEVLFANRRCSGDLSHRARTLCIGTNRKKNRAQKRTIAHNHRNTRLLDLQDQRKILFVQKLI